MTTKRETQIQYALELLEAGLLPSQLPGRLMAEFGLTPAAARDIAVAAMERHKDQK